MFTDSAGKIGTPILICLLGLCFIWNIKSLQLKSWVLIKTCIIIGAIVGTTAFINEHYTKEYIQLPRPAHIQLCNMNNNTISPNLIYQGNEDERKKIITNLIESNKSLLSQYDARALNHWIEESGFSFPSGHSCNSFLLAFIISFSMYYSRKKWIRKIYFIPFLWATGVGLSRIALGAHSALDVSVGSLLGLSVGYILLYYKQSRDLIMHRKIDLG